MAEYIEKEQPAVTEQYELVGVMEQWNRHNGTAVVRFSFETPSGKLKEVEYRDEDAIALMKWENTADFSVVNAQGVKMTRYRRIMQKVTSDGLFEGTVGGQPEP